MEEENQTEENNVPIDEISEAIKKINEGYSDLSKLDPIKSYKENKFLKRATIFLSILSGLLVYQQYIASNLKSRSDSLDQIFLFSMNSLESKSPAVQATGINNLYSVAFNSTIVESSEGVLSPIINLWNTFSNKKEYKYLDRSKSAFKIFAQSPRNKIESSSNPVSTSLLKTAVEWQIKEEQKFGNIKDGTDAWLLYKANLNKSYCPNIELSKQWFFDANFKGSYLNAAKFIDSYLERSSFTYSDLSATDFREATLNNASLDSCIINYGKFDKIQGVGADFRKSTLEEASFVKSNLKNSKFDNALIQGADFTGANLEGASFKNCNFNNVDLKDAILKNTDFSNSKMDGALNYNNKK